MKTDCDCKVILDPPGILIYPLTDIAKQVLKQFCPEPCGGYGFINGVDNEFAPHTELGRAGLTYFIQSETN